MTTPPTTPDTTPWTPILSPVTLDGYRLRELPPDEWHRLTVVPGPLQGRDLSPSGAARIIVLERTSDTSVVAYWPAFPVVHLDLLYLDAEVRRHPKLSLAMVGAMVHLLQSLGVGVVAASIADADQPDNGNMAEKLGLTPADGTLYWGEIPPAEGR